MLSFTPLCNQSVWHQSQCHVPEWVNVVCRRCMMCRFLLAVVKATMFWDEAQACISKMAGNFPIAAWVALSTIQPSSSTRIGLLGLQQFRKTHLDVVTLAPDCNSFTWINSKKKGSMMIYVPFKEKHAHDAILSKHCTCIGVPEEISHTWTL